MRGAASQGGQRGRHRGLVKAASALPNPPRFVLASSIAVYGARNPFRGDELLTASTPVRPGRLYGEQKALAEQTVTARTWTGWCCGSGGAHRRAALDDRPRLIFFEAVLPADGRIHTVDVRDVAQAFTAATVTDHVREIFLIGGDNTHRVTQASVGSELASALGLVGGLPAGRRGDPDDDLAWYATDWMDTDRSQEILAYQRHSMPDMCAQTRKEVGWRRWPVALLGPALRWYLRRRSPYRGFPGIHADPMRAIDRRWGDPRPSECLDTELQALRN